MAQIGIFPEYIVRGPQPETLVLREKVMSLSGGSSDITLMSTGQPLLRVQGQAMSLSGRKSVYDAANRHLFDIVKEHFHLHSTYACIDARDSKFMEVKSSFKLIGSSATATFTDAKGRPHALKMKGGWFDASADIVDEATGVAVARIDRKLLSGRELFGSQTYAVQVMPGVDMVLMAALCICMDAKAGEGS